MELKGYALTPDIAIVGELIKENELLKIRRALLLNMVKRQVKDKFTGETVLIQNEELNYIIGNSPLNKSEFIYINRDRVLYEFTIEGKLVDMYKEIWEPSNLVGADGGKLKKSNTIVFPK